MSLDSFTLPFVALLPIIMNIGSVDAASALQAQAPQMQHRISLGAPYFYAGAHPQSEDADHIIELPGRAHAEIQPSEPISTDGGSVVAWVMPLWDGNNALSHTFLSLRWQGEDKSYLALSQGWWEPEGSGKLYFVLSNQDFVFCLMPGEFNYSIFTANKWTMLAATWTAGKPGYVKLFVDGQKICDRRIAFSGGRRSAGALYLGSDQGSAEQRSRRSDFIIKRLQLYQNPLSETQINEQYRYGGGEPQRKWVATLVAANPPTVPSREARIIFDEDTHWSVSRLETDRTLQRVKQAGFNVYVPCVWDGGAASFETRLAPMSKAYENSRRGDYDPLQYLISAAHRQGIAVHLWFDVMRRDTVSLPAAYSEGAPVGAFNVQNADFRAYIVKLIRDAAEHYDTDGINLDYIRSMGTCTSDRCEKDYRARYGRSLNKDLEEQNTGKAVPSLIEWNAAPVSTIVLDLAKQLREHGPRLFISVDTVPFDQSRLQQGVDVSGWFAAQAIDSVVYMAYETPIDVRSVTRAWERLSPDKLVVLIRNFDVVDDRAIDNSGQMTVDYVNMVRSLWPHAGVGFYHYPHLTWQQVVALKSHVFAVPANSDWRRSDR